VAVDAGVVGAVLLACRSLVTDTRQRTAVVVAVVVVVWIRRRILDGVVGWRTKSNHLCYSRQTDRQTDRRLAYMLPLRGEIKIFINSHTFARWQLRSQFVLFRNAEESRKMIRDPQKNRDCHQNLMDSSFSHALYPFRKFNKKIKIRSYFFIPPTHRQTDR